jgi:hypothetical protein
MKTQIYSKILAIAAAAMIAIATSGTAALARGGDGFGGGQCRRHPRHPSHRIVLDQCFTERFGAGAPVPSGIWLGFAKRNLQRREAI